jgi:hypothetical protein
LALTPNKAVVESSAIALGVKLKSLLLDCVSKPTYGFVGDVVLMLGFDCTADWKCCDTVVGIAEAEFELRVLNPTVNDLFPGFPELFLFWWNIAAAVLWPWNIL